MKWLLVLMETTILCIKVGFVLFGVPMIFLGILLVLHNLWDVLFIK